MIQLVLSAVPIDEVPGRLVFATFYEDRRPLRGSTALIDWRLNGRLSELILKGQIHGGFAESVLMPSGGRLAARELLVFGLGPSGDLTEERMQQAFGRAIDKIVLLKSQEMVTCFGDLAGAATFARDFMGWRALLRNFINTLSLKYGDRDLEVICAEEPKWINEARKRNMDFGPQVTLAYA